MLVTGYSRKHLKLMTHFRVMAKIKSSNQGKYRFNHIFRHE